MSIPTMDGITERVVNSSRITTRVLFSGAEDGAAVLFLHGNLSNATWWEATMLALPEGLRGIAPDQRGYGGADPEALIDATRGLRDLADDAIALLDHMEIQKAHVVGSSLGGNVVWRLMLDHPDRLLTVTQVAPGSPYGFGGTKDVDGTPCYDDFAGSGGGLINPEVVKRLEANDLGTDSQFSPRNAFRALVVKPGFVAPREDEYVLGMNSTHLGEHAYPGDKAQSANWPYVAPGQWGPNNALSPKYAGNVHDLPKIDPKPPVLWIRGELDKVVADVSASDPGTLGKMELIPNWPGDEVYPPQPMLAQTRTLLDAYRAAGGSYREEVMVDCAHVPYIEQPAMFNALFHPFITSG